jgi:hypothetical protein
MQREPPKGALRQQVEQPARPLAARQAGPKQEV